jgi:hypothetical protein
MIMIVLGIGGNKTGNKKQEGQFEDSHPQKTSGIGRL